MSTYPRDEFDDVPEAPRRQGVHRSRAAVESSRRGIAWVLVSAAVVVLLLAAAFFIGPKLLNPTAASSAAGTQKPSASATPSPSQSASASTSSSAASSSAASSSSAATTSPSSTQAPTQPAATADRTLAVGVYHATATSGLGNRAATTARTAGWSVAAVGNWSGSPVNTSVVFYRDASQKASADALAADLGIGTVVQAQQLGFPLAAVIGPGYAG